MSKSIETERFGTSLIIRFVRPEIRNPLSILVVDELKEIIESVSSDCERLIFTGKDGVFASGADLNEIAAVSAGDAREFALRGQRLMRSISELKCDTFAAVNGFCFGGALDLALSCDYRIAEPKAQFSHPGVGLGIITGWGGTQRLPALIGEARALEMFLTARRVSAEAALLFGLVDEISANAVGRSIGRD